MRINGGKWGVATGTRCPGTAWVGTWGVYYPPLGVFVANVVDLRKNTGHSSTKVDIKRNTATLRGGSGEGCSFHTRQHCPGAVDSGTSAAHCNTGSAQWNSCRTLQHCPGAVGS